MAMSKSKSVRASTSRTLAIVAAGGAALATLVAPQRVWAQTATAEVSAPPAEAPATATSAGSTTMASDPEAMPDPERTPPSEAPVVPPKPAEPVNELFQPTLKVGMGIRTGIAMIFDDPLAGGPALTLHDGVANQYNVRPYFSGQINKWVGFTGNFETTQTGVQVLDAIVQVKVVDEFQVWMGQHIPAMERNNFNGPFYNNGWNLPIVVQTLPFDIAGRDRGVTMWGLVAGGLIKYHASIVDLAPPAGVPVGTNGAGIGNARFAGRVTLNLLDPENYYYTSGTYYGEQDTLAIGAVIQGQKGPDAVGGGDLDNDLLAFHADVLFEKNLQKAGVITLEGGYWNMDGTGAQYQPNQGTTNFGTGAVGPLVPQSFLFSASWLTPDKIGFGKIQPLAKLQVVDNGAGASATWALDAGVGYIIDGFNHRWFANFRHQDNPGVDMLQVGAQLQL